MTDDRYAGLGKRILAFLLDGIILGAVGIIFAYTGFAVLPEKHVPVLQLGLGIIIFGYFVYFEGRSGQTLGKRGLGIAVVKENDAPMTYGAAAIRNILRIVDGQFLYLIGIAVIALSEDNQRIGDMLADTVVVKTGP